jgi:galacturan 1,4-alpha-galacturonidase
MSDDLNYWRNNSYPIAFQNHHAGIIFSGERIYINGYGTGGINGQGNAWYNVEKGATQPGRPMPFVFWNASDVFVEHCKSPALEYKLKLTTLQSSSRTLLSGLSTS